MPDVVQRVIVPDVSTERWLVTAAAYGDQALDHERLLLVIEVEHQVHQNAAQPGCRRDMQTAAHRVLKKYADDHVLSHPVNKRTDKRIELPNPVDNLSRLLHEILHAQMRLGVETPHDLFPVTEHHARLGEYQAVVNLLRLFHRHDCES